MSALCGNKEISKLIHDNLFANAEQKKSPPPTPPDEIAAAKKALQPDNSRTFRQLTGLFKMILASIESIAREKHVGSLSDLRKSLDDCLTLESLAGKSGEVLSTVDTVVNRSAEEIDFTNKLMMELSQNLSEMEGQLFSHQSHNRETYELQGQFLDNLLSHTHQMDQAVVSSKTTGDALQTISSRLAIVAKAIQIKRKADESRLKASDSALEKLQMNVRSYHKEITLATMRADELEKEVLLDPLLQIHNRRAYDQKIDDAIKSYHRTGVPFSLIMLDVDHFKKVNDEFGQRAGDKCLQQVAKLVESSVRQTDFVARYGGEELMVILPWCIAENAYKIAEKIRDRVDKARLYYNDKVICLTVSLGLTQAQSSDIDAGELFVRVDKAISRSKNEGRNRVSVI